MRQRILAILFVLCGSVGLANEPTPEQIEAAHKNCESGNMEACRALGIFYFSQEYGNDYAKAAEFLTKACGEKDLLSCAIAGAAYNELEDFVNAQKYLSMVCGAKNIANNPELKQVELSACADLGKLYYAGKGVRQDFQKAKELNTKACNGKNSGACYNLGVLYQNGEGVRQNLATAKEYYGKACDLGDQGGCDMYKELNQAGH